MFLNLSSILRIDLSSQWINELDDNPEIYNNLCQVKELNIRQNLLYKLVTIMDYIRQIFSSSRNLKC